MSLTKRRANHGVSTVFGSILFIILVVALMSTLSVALFQYNKASEIALNSEQQRAQEKIALKYLTTDTNNNILKIRIDNMGSVLTKIRAIYIDEQLICDPSTYALTSISPQGFLLLDLQPTTQYVPTSKLIATTETGIKSIEYESVLKGDHTYVQRTPSNFGPLALNYADFTYGGITGSTYPTSGWLPGWTVPGGSEIVWKISVNSTISKNIILNEYSCFTLVTTSSPRTQIPWYIDKVQHQDGTFSNTIQPFENFVTITYRYNTPLNGNQKITFPSNTLSDVFLTCYGSITDVTTSKPYGQTIPFEAILNT
jgi:hypothetical protein